MARRPTSQQSQVDALLKAHTVQVRNAFLAALQAAGSRIDMRALIAALRDQDIDRAIGLFRMDQALLFPLDEAVRGAYVAAGSSVATALPRLPAGAFGFNGSHPRALDYLRQSAADRLTNEVERVKLVARQAITEGLERNVGAERLARDLAGRVVGTTRQGGIIGLTAPQERSIRSGIDKLASGDPVLMREYLGLKERDMRYDGLIKRSIKAEKAPARADLDRIRAGHIRKATGRRAERVARNETFTAQAIGRDEGWRQVADRDDVETVEKLWRHGLSDPARQDHQALDGTRLPVGEDFVMGDGRLMAHPHDPRGGPEHSMGCRCVAIYRPVLAKR